MLLHDMVKFTMIWLIIMSTLHYLCYIDLSFMCFTLMGFVVFAPHDYPPPNVWAQDREPSAFKMFTCRVAKYVLNFFLVLRAEVASLFAFCGDREQHQRLKRAWDAFKVWYFPLVVVGLGKAGQSLTLRIECAVVICLVWALAQADRAEREELKGEIEELKIRLDMAEDESGSEGEGWSVVGEQDLKTPSPTIFHT